MLPFAGAAPRLAVRPAGAFEGFRCGSARLLPPAASTKRALHGRRAARTVSVRAIADTDEQRQVRGVSTTDEGGAKGLNWLAPVVVPLALFATYVTPLMTPYFKQLIADAPNQPEYLHIPGVDKLLQILTPFFANFRVEQCGTLALGYFLTYLFAWSITAAVESCRSDSKGHKPLKWGPTLIPLCIVVGTYLIIPALWLTAYLRSDSDNPTAEWVEEKKKVPAAKVAAATAVLFAGFVPLLGTMFTSGHDLAVCAVAIFTTPFIWPLFYSRLTTPSDRDGPAGHKAAVAAHLLAAGACLAFQAVAAIQLVQHPDLLQQTLALFGNHEGALHSPLFLVSTLPVLAASFLFVPFYQEGWSATTMYFLASVVLGPGTVHSLYFAYRENKYLSLSTQTSSLTKAE
eukprot:SM000366S13825  [mRNA]  locus=s366:48343:50893:- [translate_table: standard]